MGDKQFSPQVKKWIYTLNSQKIEREQTKYIYKKTKTAFYSKITKQKFSLFRKIKNGKNVELKLQIWLFILQ